MLAVAGPAVVGHFALVGAIGAGAGAMVAAERRPALARRATTASAAAAAVAVGVLAMALVTRDYRLAYVAEVVARPASRPYRLAGLWAAMGGSLLLYAAMAAVAVAAAGRGVRRRHAMLVGPYVRAASLVPSWLLALVWWADDPFRVLSQPAIDGRGLTPILEHPAMLVHPPLLYAGTVVAVPLAALAAAAWSRHQTAEAVSDADVVATLVRWALVGLVVLTAALALGAHWAYVEVGWGGFWAWDPVENGGLLVWLAFVAVVHAARRPHLAARAAQASLAAAIAGAVLTRSGAAASVHAFGEAARVGYGLAGLAAVLAVFAAIAAGRGRRHRIAVRLDTPESQRVQGAVEPAGLAARLATVQVVVVAVTAAVITLGTAWPVVAGWVDGRRRALDPRFFTASIAPLAAVACAGALVALAATGRVVGGGTGRVAGGGTGRVVGGGTARVAMLLAHGGFVLLVGASWASSFGADRTVTLRPGGSATVGGVTITAGRPVAVERAGYRLVEAPVEVRGRGDAANLRPALRVYETAGAVLPETARRAGWLLDTQLALRRFDDAGGVALDVHVRPAVRLVWIAAVSMLAGFALAAITRRWSLAVPVATAHDG